MAEPKSLRRQRANTLEKAHGWGRYWIALARIVCYPLAYVLARTKVIGLSNIPAEGPVLLVFNHVSYLDPVYHAVTVHRAGRIPRFMAKNTLWKVPVLNNVLVGTEQIPVFRGTASARKSLEQAHQALEAGKTTVIYPDGTVTKDPQGWPMAPKWGVSRLALAHDIPIIPAAIWGTREVYDHYAKKFRPLPRKQVTIKIGAPIDLSAYRGKDPESAVLREAAELTMQRVRELLGEIRGEQPPVGFSSPRQSATGNDA